MPKSFPKLSPLAQLRKSAPAGTKLSTSRQARSKNQQSARLYHGTGNMPRYIRTFFPDITKHELAMLTYESNAIADARGQAPTYEELKTMRGM